MHVSNLEDRLYPADNGYLWKTEISRESVFKECVPVFNQ